MIPQEEPLAGSSFNMSGRRSLFVICFIPLLVWTAGCALLPAQGDPTEVPPELQNTIIPGFEFDFGAEIRQWAISASASSEYSNDEWSAENAAGSPNTERCGDYQTSWASAASDSISTLVLTYTQPVYPQAVIVYQTFNPDQVSQIRVLGVEDDTQVIYEAEPQQIDQPCPYILTVPVSDVNFRVNRLEVTVDQSVLGMGWNQIDAVELVGDLEQ
jgi:hypothetical protein